MKLRPDGFVVVPAAAQPTCVPLLLEVETGRKEISFEELAYAHALRSNAARASRILPVALVGLGVPAVRPFRVLYVAASPTLDERPVAGITRAITALQPRDEALVLPTSLDRLHPRIVLSSRVERAASLRRWAARYFAPAWRTVASDERTPLFR